MRLLGWQGARLGGGRVGKIGRGGLEPSRLQAQLASRARWRPWRQLLARDFLSLALRAPGTDADVEADA
jgi:hypothetical protein